MNQPLSSLEVSLLAVVFVLSFALWGVTRHFLRYRRARREQGRGRPWQLRRLPPSELDPVFAPDQALGFTHATEVSFISVGSLPVMGVTSDYESWILAVLARKADTLFEFGTCTGRTTYLWARNSPPGARVYTLTLGNGKSTGQYQAGAGDDPREEDEAYRETVSGPFMYTGTDVAHKVVQLYGDSKAFDETALLGACDLIFVDGAHAHTYVLSDSAKALRMIRPGGVIVWHDYRGPHQFNGLFRALNKLGEQLPLMHIEGTALVAYRAPLRERSSAVDQACRSAPDAARLRETPVVASSDHLGNGS